MSDLINFEVAKLAYQHGFREKNGFVWDSDFTYSKKDLPIPKRIRRSFNGCDITDFKGRYSHCSTNSKLCDWLEENFNIHVETKICFYKNKQVFKVKIAKVADIGTYFAHEVKPLKHFDKRQQAFQEGFLEAFKLIELYYTSK